MKGVVTPIMPPTGDWSRSTNSQPSSSWAQLSAFSKSSVYGKATPREMSGSVHVSVRPFSLLSAARAVGAGRHDCSGMTVTDAQVLFAAVSSVSLVTVACSSSAVVAISGICTSKS